MYHARNPHGDPFVYNPDANPNLDIIGLVLWVTEGDKTQLSLSNGNPAIIKKYLEFLRTVCGLKETKIKGVIHCHDTLSYQTCLHYWSRITHIPSNRFNKPHIKRDKGGNQKYPYGIVRITAVNTKLLHIFKERLRVLGLSRD